MTEPEAVPDIEGNDLTPGAFTGQPHENIDKPCPGCQEFCGQCSQEDSPLDEVEVDAASMTVDQKLDFLAGRVYALEHYVQDIMAALAGVIQVVEAAAEQAGAPVIHLPDGTTTPAPGINRAERRKIERSLRKQS